MGEYVAKVSWQRGEQSFTDNKYSRVHSWEFDGGLMVPASSSPEVVPLPYSAAENIDLEEAFVASLSSCHMLWFLAIAAKKRLTVDSYADNAVGILETYDGNKMWLAKVLLRPSVLISGDKQADREQILQMHEAAHENCYIANSVASEIVIEPIFE
jgi:organic hydroperoxide reductase OsmC/OhrA